MGLLSKIRCSSPRPEAHNPPPGPGYGQQAPQQTSPYQAPSAPDYLNHQPPPYQAGPPPQYHNQNQYLQAPAPYGVAPQPPPQMLQVPPHGQVPPQSYAHDQKSYSQHPPSDKIILECRGVANIEASGRTNKNRTVCKQLIHPRGGSMDRPMYTWDYTHDSKGNKSADLVLNRHHNNDPSESARREVARMEWSSQNWAEVHLTHPWMDWGWYNPNDCWISDVGTMREQDMKWNLDHRDATSAHLPSDWRVHQCVTTGYADQGPGKGYQRTNDGNFEVCRTNVVGGDTTLPGELYFEIELPASVFHNGTDAQMDEIVSQAIMQVVRVEMGRHSAAMPPPAPPKRRRNGGSNNGFSSAVMASTAACC